MDSFLRFCHEAAGVWCVVCGVWCVVCGVWSGPHFVLETHSLTHSLTVCLSVCHTDTDIAYGSIACYCMNRFFLVFLFFCCFFCFFCLLFVLVMGVFAFPSALTVFIPMWSSPSSCCSACSLLHARCTHIRTICTSCYQTLYRCPIRNSSLLLLPHAKCVHLFRH